MGKTNAKQLEGTSSQFPYSAASQAAIHRFEHPGFSFNVIPMTVFQSPKVEIAREKHLG